MALTPEEQAELEQLEGLVRTEFAKRPPEFQAKYKGLLDGLGSAQDLPMQRSQSKQNAARVQSELDDEQNRSWLDKGASLLMGNRDGFFGSLSDEVGSTVDFVKENPASLAALLSPMGLPYLMTGSNIGEDAEQRRANNVSMSQDAQESDPGLYGGGQLAGTALQALYTAPVTTGKGVLNAAKGGGAIGAVMGAAEGEGSDRAGNALLGAGLGTVIGAGAGKVGNAASNLANRVKVGLKPKQSLGPFEMYLKEAGHQAPPVQPKPKLPDIPASYADGPQPPSISAQLDEMTRTHTVQPDQILPSPQSGTNTFTPDSTVTGPSLNNEPQLVGGFGNQAGTPEADSFAAWVKSMNDPIQFTPGQEVSALPKRHQNWAEASNLDDMAPETLDEMFPKIKPDEEMIATTPRINRTRKLDYPSEDTRISKIDSKPAPTLPEPAPQPVEAPVTVRELPEGVDSVPSNWPPPEPSAERWQQLMAQYVSDLPPVPPITPRNPNPPSADYMPSKGKNKAGQARARERKDQGTYKKPPKKKKKNPWQDD
jgi:hypothetical protein